MDTSKEYIKMCEKAPKELWGLVKDRYGTPFVWRGFLGILRPICSERKKLTGIASIIPETLVVRFWLKNNEDIIVTGKSKCNSDCGTPLYRQDQLQGMVNCEYEIVKDHKGFCAVVNEETINHKMKGGGWHFTSMEQLWLAFVMKEKYHKIWNGENWIEEG